MMLRGNGWRRAVGRAFVACPCLVLAAGCGGPERSYESGADADMLKALAKLDIKKTTLTPEELGETYPERAHSAASEPIRPAYERMAEEDVFDWAYLEDVAQRRRELLRRTVAEQRELARKRRAERKKALERKAAQEAEARRREEARARVEAAKKGVPEARPPEQ